MSTSLLNEHYPSPPEMHTAQIQQWGQTPNYIELPDLPHPPPNSDMVQVKVEAAGLHRLVRSRASGKHYSVTNLPHTPGVDGVGRTLDGQLVYFSCIPEQVGGSFREIVNVPKRMVTPLPRGTDPIQAAGLVNPALSSVCHVFAFPLSIDFSSWDML